MSVHVDTTAHFPRYLIDGTEYPISASAVFDILALYKLDYYYYY